MVVALECDEDDERQQDGECRAEYAEDRTRPLDVREETAGGRAPTNQVHGRDRADDNREEHEGGRRQRHASVLTSPTLLGGATMPSTLPNSLCDSAVLRLRQRSAFVMTELSPAAVSSATWSRNLWKSSEPDRSAMARGMAGNA
jgi:hypothetical protein